MRLTCLLLCLAALATATAQRVTTTRDNLSANERVTLDSPGRSRTATPDSAASPGRARTAVPDTVSPGDITLRGYSKRPMDNKESVMVTNNTGHTIAAVHVHLTYRTMSGEVFNERDVTIRAVLEPGKTTVSEFRTFDTHHEFYYHGSGKPRKSATPYDVSYTLLGYDITIGRRTSLR